MQIYKTIIISLVASSLLISPNLALAKSDDNVLALRRAYFRMTGGQWDDASPDAQAKFLKLFERQERARLKLEAARKRAEEKKEQQKLRNKKQDQRQLAQLEKEYLRQKRAEERKLAQEKKEREKKLQDMKKKMRKQRKGSR